MKRILLALAFAALALLPGSTARTDAATLCIGAGGTWHCGAKAFPGASGAYQTPKAAWIGAGGAWQPFYSTPAVSASNVSGSTSAGAGSGTPSTTISPNTTLSGNYFPSASFSWGCTANCAGISINNAANQNPIWSATLSASCNSSNTANSTWRVVATDGIGYQATSNNINVQLTFTNTTPCIGPFTVSASNSSYNAGSCGPGGGGRTCPYTWFGNSTVTISGGPVSGNMSYSWTYVSGTVPTSTSGTNTANFTNSTNTACAAASACDESTIWNVHVIDLVSGYSADAQATMSGHFVNNTG